MANVEVGTDGIALGAGNGPNHVEVRANRHRAGVAANAGVAGTLNVAGGKLHAGGGVAGAASINPNPGPYVPTSNYATRPDIITARDAANVGAEAKAKTNGTGDLRDVPLMSLFDTITRYPELLKYSHSARIATFMAAVSDTKLALDDSRRLLLDAYTGSDIFKEFPKLESMLSTPVTSRGLERVTIRDLQREVGDAALIFQKLDERTQLITGPRDQALQHISNWISERQPEIKLTDEQKNAILDGLRGAAREVTALQDKLAGTVTPEEVRTFYDKANCIARYDPRIDVDLYGTAAYERALGKATLVAGGMVGQGLRYDIDSVYATRDETGHPHLKWHAAKTTKLGAHIGLGENAFVAMSTESARRLGIEPAAGLGGYVYTQQEQVRLFGEKTSSRETGIALKYSEGKGDSYTYMEAGVAQEKRPAETPKTKVQLNVGRIF